MKKISAIAIIALLSLSLASCGGNESVVDSTASNDQSVSDTNESSEESSEASSEEASEDSDAEAEGEDASGNDAEAQAAEGALGLLNTVWNSYGENDKFPIIGGDLSEENVTEDAPGQFDITDTESLDARLAFPAASVGQIDDAASIVHMMNANTFTCGAFHLANIDDAADVAAAIKDNVMQRQWLCGFPEKLVIVQADDYLVSFFGTEDLTNAFCAKLTAAYPGAETLCDESIL